MPPKLYFPNADELRQWELRFHGPSVPVKEGLWFRQNQAALLSLANTDYGRDLLCLDPKRQRPEPITRLTKNLCSYYLGQQNGRHYWATDGRVGAKWGNVIRSRWLEVNAALEKHRARLFLEELLRLPRLRLIDGRVLWPVGGGITTTAYPDPDVEIATVDGDVARDTVNEEFSLIRGGAGNLARPSDAGASCQLGATTTSPNYVNLFRFVSLFDFSAIADTNTKDSATYELVVSAKNDPFSPAGSYSMIATTPASNTNLVAGDYANVGTIKQAPDKTIASVTADSVTYNPWTLNAAGLTSLSLTTISKFGLCVTYDTDNAPPTWLSGAVVYLALIAADTAGIGTDPKIVLIHSAAPFVPRVTIF